MLKKTFLCFILTYNLHIYSQNQNNLTQTVTSAPAKEELNLDLIWNKGYFRQKGFPGFNAMNDGEHYTKFSNKDNQIYIVKKSIKDRTIEDEILNVSKLEKFGIKSTDVNDYSFNQKEDQILIISNVNPIYRRSYTADYYVYDLKTNTLNPLDTERPQASLATFSPDGKKIAYIYKNNLFVKDLESNHINQVTFDGKFNEIINGTTDWVYEEEFAITEGFKWSFDSKYISFLKFDESKVKEFTMQYFNNLYPDNYTFKYPKAGEENSKVSLHIYDIDKNETKELSQLPKYEYIPRFSWSPIENKLVVLTLNRHQNEANYISIDVKQNALEYYTFYTEKSKTYIDIDDALELLSDGKSLIRSSEKNGYKHLYRLYFSGKDQQITSGNFDIIDYYGISKDNKRIFYSAAAKDAIHKGVYSINVSGKNIKALTEETGYNDALFINGMNYFLNYYSTANTPNIITLRNATGKIIETLETNNVLVEKIKKFNLNPKEFIKINTPNGYLNASIIKPIDFDETKKYPVYIHVYGGPGSNLVLNRFGGNDYFFHQILTQNNYIVLCVDPRGTQYRGEAFKKSTYLQLGKNETEDLIETAKEISKWTFVDKNRIGVQGWSYGGYMSSLAITKGADYFKMGIAIAPVTNWRYYDNIYTERFMRTPAENAKGYDDNSPINHVDKIKGKYFLIHGSGDDNVHYQNAMEMITALTKANKQFDMFIYPNKDHSIGGGNTRFHLYTMILDYVKKNL